MKVCSCSVRGRARGCQRGLVSPTQHIQTREQPPASFEGFRRNSRDASCMALERAKGIQTLIETSAASEKLLARSVKVRSINSRQLGSRTVLLQESEKSPPTSRLQRRAWTIRRLRHMAEPGISDQTTMSVCPRVETISWPADGLSPLQQNRWSVLRTSGI